jgi:hypothetical protein
MAIVFDCPHCKTNYKLKDDVGGKTATCKNPNCRKVINIPMPTGPVKVAAPADLDAFAAAAFADDPAAKPVAEELLSVTCAKCDHSWQVEASKEGKNVLCPECRHPNKVPLRKKAEKADWKSGGAGPSYAKRETGLEAGGFGTNLIGGIGTETAREIVKDRDSQEEPEEKRKRRLKLAGYLTLAFVVIGAATYFAVKTRNTVRSDARMDDAVKEVEAEAGKDPRYKALIHRASGEYEVRTGTEITAALNDFKTARNAFGNQPAPGVDRNIILAEIAVSMADLIGTPDEVQDGKRIELKTVVTEIRQTLQRIPGSEIELLADTIRALTRKFANHGQAAALEGILMQLTPNGPELLGQMALELLRLDKDKHQAAADKVLKTPGADTIPSLIAVRMALGKPAPKPATGKKEAPNEPARAKVEAEVLTGNAAAAKATAKGVRPDDRPWALTAGGMAALDSNPTEAAEMLTEAAAMLETNRSPATPAFAIRVCRGLGKLGKLDVADKLANSVTDEQSKAWAKLEVVRGRMLNAKGSKAEDAWLDAVGDPAKLGAAIKVREEVARHNAANGHEYDKTIKGWAKGTQRPFGMAGTILGREDGK